MSFLDLNLGNVEDLKLVTDGEYLLQCLRAEVKTSGKGGQYINLQFSLPNEPTAELRCPSEAPRETLLQLNSAASALLGYRRSDQLNTLVFQWLANKAAVGATFARWQNIEKTL